ncbi:MAG TPA: radical SAM protein [Desulfobacterales bacterium]|nr:radical SAM protein [Desulfobacterales bacterium]
MEYKVTESKVELQTRLKGARELSWRKFGKRITFYLPGMFNYYGIRGKYPALSITGAHCQLMCDHCRAKILEPMVPVEQPALLVERCMGLKEKGCHGVLLSGGCDMDGRLPWHKFLDAMAEVKAQTGLYISIHCGLLDRETAVSLKQAGVDQALLDVIGDDQTYQSVYHVNFGVEQIASTMEALNQAGLALVPHIICGLNRGEIRSEMDALRMVAHFQVEQLVIVSLMSIKGTPLHKAPSPNPEDIAEIMVEARFMMPGVPISLGCARKRGDERIELLAIEGGINRMALPSEAAIERAKSYGLEISYQKTCCSVAQDFSAPKW